MRQKMSKIKTSRFASETQRNSKKLKETQRISKVRIKNPIPVAEHVNYDFVKTTTLTDLLTFF
jgi:hypothetical protein